MKRFIIIVSSGKGVRYTYERNEDSLEGLLEALNENVNKGIIRSILIKEVK